MMVRVALLCSGAALLAGLDLDPSWGAMLGGLLVLSAMPRRRLGAAVLA